MKNLFSWVASHKLTVVLLLAVGYLLWNKQGGPVMPLGIPSPEISSYNSGVADTMMVKSAGGGVASLGFAGRSYMPPIANDSISQSEERMVVTDTWLSLVTNNVSDTLKNIENAAKTAGGFMVNSGLTVPEGASSGNITIRVPSEKRDEVLQAIRGFGVKVIDENVSGTDVTADYEDLDAQLAILTTTKTKFEAIQQRAVTVQEMLEVQRELTNLQSQIDNVKGRQMYLAKTVSLAKITVYLSTDELALPYTPDESWRPAAVFKEAVRGLILTMRGVADKAIWVAVYAPVWVPLLLIVLWVKKKHMRSL